MAQQLSPLLLDTMPGNNEPSVESSEAPAQAFSLLARMQRWCCLRGSYKPRLDDEVQLKQEEEEEGDSVDEYGDAGEPCEICNDDEKVKTHYAKPCRHSLCETCWERWLEQSTKCPICGVEVLKTVRFPSALVPLQYDELAKTGNSTSTRSMGANMPQMYSLNTELEKLSQQVISSLVQSKDSFISMGITIAEVNTHLTNVVSEGVDFETRMSIVAVEKSTIGDQFEQLAQLMSDSQSSSWASANTAIQGFSKTVDKLSDVLDECTDAPPSGLSSTQNLLSNCTVAMLRGQWTPMHAALTKLTSTQIPAVLQQLAAAQHPLGQPHELQAMQRAVQMLQLQAQAKIQNTESHMQHLLSELEVVAVRVNSMFC
eukprot:TRINITY_DN13931_c0_g1_i1.p1 TRINITY_DN13931_c0_g1~~TRINITY_DN13931_c0_g1_i1.p1  ORF type:complete len:371 (-),score=70.96 TRINITY_DN13931_c0_g1_i1:398-1510(-)